MDERGNQGKVDKGHPWRIDNGKAHQCTLSKPLPGGLDDMADMSCSKLFDLGTLLSPILSHNLYQMPLFLPLLLFLQFIFHTNQNKYDLETMILVYFSKLIKNNFIISSTNLKCYFHIINNNEYYIW